MILRVRGVNDALYQGVQLMTGELSAEMKPKEVASRNGPTLEWPEPVVTVYTRPLERVLFAPERDANPFFHLFESLWMLAGRQDVSSIAVFNSRMREYSDDGVSFHGAYGYRWRIGFGYDQIEECVTLLNRDRGSRRAVLTMWSPELDLCTTSKDLPCNTQVYFKVRDGELRTTITCRSNDMLWGAYGANAVHFSMLHEYMAGRLQVRVGPLIQLSDSFHVYLDGPGGTLWDKLKARSEGLWQHDLYQRGDVRPTSLFAHRGEPASQSAWDDDLVRFFEAIDEGSPLVVDDFTTSWFRGVLLPMMKAFASRDLEDARRIEASDWRTAATDWIRRRQS